LAARRSKALLNPVVPIFAVFAGPRRRDVERSRDLGVNGVIVRPISPRTIMNKLGPALVEPRPFIAAPNFFGPDRRARTRLFGFRDRRARTPRKTRIQVLDI
jgi:hypothetical protein